MLASNSERFWKILMTMMIAFVIVCVYAFGNSAYNDYRYNTDPAYAKKVDKYNKEHPVKRMLVGRVLVNVPVDR